MEHYLKLSLLIVVVVFLVSSALSICWRHISSNVRTFCHGAKTIHAWLKHYDPILPQIAVIGLATIPSFMDTVSTLPSASIWLWLRFALVLSLVLSFCVHVLVRYDAAVPNSLRARFAAAAHRCVYYATQSNSKLHLLYRNVVRTGQSHRAHISPRRIKLSVFQTWTAFQCSKRDRSQNLGTHPLAIRMDACLIVFHKTGHRRPPFEEAGCR